VKDAAFPRLRRKWPGHVLLRLLGTPRSAPRIARKCRSDNTPEFPVIIRDTRGRGLLFCAEGGGRVDRHRAARRDKDSDDGDEYQNGRDAEEAERIGWFDFV